MITKKFIGRLPAPPLTKKTSLRRSGYTGWGRNLFFHIILFGISILLINCSPHSSVHRSAPNKPETRAFDMEPDTIIKGVKRVLAIKKFNLSAGQTSRYFLQTEWLQDGKYRSMVQAEVKPLGKNRSELTVHIHLQKKNMWQESWQPVGEIGKNIYDDFLDDVQIESYRALYDRR